MKRLMKVLTIIMGLFFSTALFAQEDAEFERFMNQSNLEFNRFNDSINQQFALQLLRQWKQFQVLQGLERSKKPKPTVLPIAPEFPSDSIHSQQLPLINTDSVKPIPPVFPPEKNTGRNVYSEPEKDSLFNINGYSEDNIQSNMQILQIPFCGIVCNVKIPIQNYYNNVVADNRSISRFWTSLSNIDFSGVKKQCLNFIENNQLNDWGLYKFIVHLSAAAFPDRPNQQIVFTVFMLNQLGYDAKIGYTHHNLVTLLSVRQQVYATPFIKHYYLFDENGNSDLSDEAIYTYNVSFPNATRSIDMQILNEMFPASTSIQKNNFSIANEEISINYLSEIIEFFRNYPQLNIEIYASAKGSQVFNRSIKEQFLPHLANLSQYEAVGYLLHYVQKAFEYAPDNEQFGYEKPLFCEENFYYSKNDCEDRSVLFSYLVRNLLNLPVVLLDYQDHVATAVALDENVVGDYVVYNNRKYVVCDPTYIGARIGESIPEYRGVGTTVILLNK